jgi:glycosyltransferase involved in cell wall biosynthesis
VPEPRDWLRDRPPAIATGAPTAEAVRALVRDVVVVRPGLDPCFTTAGNAPRGAPDAVQVVAVGTVAPGKGQLLLVQALRAAGAPCQLTLLGDLNGAPDYVTAVRAAVGPLPVQLRGVVPPEEVAAVLRGADLFVSASRSESFGMAVAEAAACGVPVLAFATGEIPALVRDGATGWLLPPDASDAAFTTALHDIVRAPERLAAARRAHGMPVLPGWEQAAAAFRDACLALTGGADRGGTGDGRPPA